MFRTKSIPLKFAAACIVGMTAFTGSIVAKEAADEPANPTAVFAAPAPYTPGNLGYGTMLGPGTVSWDFSVYKTFSFSERHRLPLYGESDQEPRRRVPGQSSS